MRVETSRSTRRGVARKFNNGEDAGALYLPVPQKETDPYGAIYALKRALLNDHPEAIELIILSANGDPVFYEGTFELLSAELLVTSESRGDVENATGWMRMLAERALGSGFHDKGLEILNEVVRLTGETRQLQRDTLDILYAKNGWPEEERQMVMSLFYGEEKPPGLPEQLVGELQDWTDQFREEILRTAGKDGKLHDRLEQYLMGTMRYCESRAKQMPDYSRALLEVAFGSLEDMLKLSGKGDSVQRMALAGKAWEVPEVVEATWQFVEEAGLLLEVGATDKLQALTDQGLVERADLLRMVGHGNLAEHIELSTKESVKEAVARVRAIDHTYSGKNLWMTCKNLLECSIDWCEPDSLKGIQIRKIIVSKLAEAVNFQIHDRDVGLREYFSDMVEVLVFNVDSYESRVAGAEISDRSRRIINDAKVVMGRGLQDNWEHFRRDESSNRVVRLFLALNKLGGSRAAAVIERNHLSANEVSALKVQSIELALTQSPSQNVLEIAQELIHEWMRTGHEELAGRWENLLREVSKKKKRFRSVDQNFGYYGADGRRVAV